jgi:hypothetical protein
VATDEGFPCGLTVVTNVPAEVLSSDGACPLDLRLEVLCLILKIVESNYYCPDDVVSTKVAPIPLRLWQRWISGGDGWYLVGGGGGWALCLWQRC